MSQQSLQQKKDLIYHNFFRIIPGAWVVVVFLQKIHIDGAQAQYSSIDNSKTFLFRPSMQLSEGYLHVDAPQREFKTHGLFLSLPQQIHIGALA